MRGRGIQSDVVGKAGQNAVSDVRQSELRARASCVARCASSWPGTGPGLTSRESCAPCSESFLLLRPREVECLVLLGGEFCPHCEGLLSLGVCRP